MLKQSFPKGQDSGLFSLRLIESHTPILQSPDALSLYSKQECADVPNDVSEKGILGFETVFPTTPLRLLVFLTKIQHTKYSRRAFLNNKQHKKISKMTNKRNFNPFIAFRSFYSKSINNSKVQKELSKLLADIWKHDLSEKEKLAWARFSEEYKVSNDQCSFYEWMMKRNGWANHKPLVRKHNAVHNNNKNESYPVWQQDAQTTGCNDHYLGAFIEDIFENPITGQDIFFKKRE